MIQDDLSDIPEELRKDFAESYENWKKSFSKELDCAKKKISFFEKNGFKVSNFSLKPWKGVFGNRFTIAHNFGRMTNGYQYLPIENNTQAKKSLKDLSDLKLHVSGKDIYFSLPSASSETILFYLVRKNWTKQVLQYDFDPEFNHLFSICSDEQKEIIKQTITDCLIKEKPPVNYYPDEFKEIALFL